MRPADLRGDTGYAWKLKKPEPGAGRKDWEACLESWLLNGPGFHPMWKWWQISVVHLRDVPNVPSAFKHYPEAEYEFVIIALNPEKGTPDVELFEAGKEYGHPKRAKFLVPQDVSQQFHGVTDVQAAKICEVAIKAILNGHISPDQDYRQQWKHSIEETVRHMNEGRHDGAKII